MKAIAYSTCTICGITVESESWKTTRCPRHQDYKLPVFEREGQHHPAITPLNKNKRRYRPRIKVGGAVVDPEERPNIEGGDDCLLNDAIAQAKKEFTEQYRPEDHL